MKLERVTLWAVRNGWNKSILSYYTEEWAARNRTPREDYEVAKQDAWVDEEGRYYVVEAITSPVQKVATEDEIDKILSKFTDEEKKFLRSNPEFLKPDYKVK